jgi:hypothetical protein
MAGESIGSKAGPCSDGSSSAGANGTGHEAFCSASRPGLEWPLLRGKILLRIFRVGAHSGQHNLLPSVLAAPFKPQSVGRLSISASLCGFWDSSVRATPLLTIRPGIMRARLRDALSMPRIARFSSILRGCRFATNKLRPFQQGHITTDRSV